MNVEKSKRGKNTMCDSLTDPQKLGHRLCALENTGWTELTKNEMRQVLTLEYTSSDESFFFFLFIYLFIFFILFFILFFIFIFFFYYNTDTLHTILKQVYSKQKQIILHTILLLAPLLIMQKLTLHIITYTTNCKTTHTHNTRTHSWARNRIL